MPYSAACLRAIADLNMLDQDGQIFVQHTRRIILPDQIGSLKQTKSKRYGNSLLSRYRLG